MEGHRGQLKVREWYWLFPEQPGKLCWCISCRGTHKQAGRMVMP